MTITNLFLVLVALCVFISLIYLLIYFCRFLHRYMLLSLNKLLKTRQWKSFRKNVGLFGGASLCVVVGILLIFYGIVLLRSIDLSFLSSEIKAYPIECVTTSSSFKCIKYRTQKPLTFKVMKDQQIVIDDNLNRLKNCTVRDRKNWKCGNSFSESGFIKGDYFDSNQSVNIEYVSRYDWIMKSL